MADPELSRRRFRTGSFLGEISALSFLPLPPHLSSFPILLAGTGSQLLVYDVESGNLLNSFLVFQGIRVHGISLRSPDPTAPSPSRIVDFLIAVFGERRVKLFLLHFDAESCGRSGDRVVIRLELVDQLTRFDHWVLDACFLKEDDHLAVGLSDNSVALWDISRSNPVVRVKSTEKCLLYSMRMWGESIEGLRVASGTIYNEIIVWKLTSQDVLPSSAFLMESINQQYMPIHLSRLTGHEGSIFRIAWSSDGSKLMSVSDDRSARIWIINGQRQDFGDSEEIIGCHLSVNLVLFGHNARIWDCYISDSIVITAGEDCSCRVWGMDGKPLLTIKEHIGRGIWRCLYDPGSSLLITAGFDSAIKVHLLHSSTLRETSDQNGVLNELKNRTEIFTICAPKVSKQLAMMDRSCFGARIMCLDASIKDEVLICGDQRGNLIMYPLSEGLIVANSSKTAEMVSVLNHFKAAHGISSVTSIFIAALNFNQVELRTTGGDGCICYFKYDKYLQVLEFIGMKQVKELSTIQSVPTNSTSEEELAQENYAIGFTSADFIMWSLTNETKMLQIPCGGWRRSYSYHLGAVPEYQNCFAYVKDHNIHIHRLWVPVQERQLFPNGLHMQYHGREIHSLCFISFRLQPNSVESCYLWIATGCEDGTVRLTRYTYFGMGSWCDSRLLGEHVGGSAVRSIYFTSKIYTISAGETCSSNGRDTCHALSDSSFDQFILISVGAKQVLTSWLLRYRTPEIEEAHLNGPVTESEHISSPPTELSSISFQWLSTHMPTTHRKVKNLMEISEKANASTIKSASSSKSCLAECRKEKPKPALVDQNENDWRYMAVTAFLVKHADSRLTVCFVAVACSDATLTLRALLLPYRLWFDIATLVPQTSLVLALQHVVIPWVAHSKDNVQSGNAYIIISGSTDGSITFWDLTEAVEYFMQLVLELQPEMLIDCQRRPQTGRGSQGGRWWRSLTNQSSGKSIGDDALSKTTGGNDTGCRSTENNSSDASCMRGSDPMDSQTSCSQTTQTTSFPMPRRHSDILPSEMREVQPLHILNSIHQSGVNCLHVSEMQDCLHSESEIAYCVLSGGDDQALHCLAFSLAVQTTDPDYSSSQSTDITDRTRPSGSSFIRKCSHPSLNKKYELRILYRHRIESAHSSAVKGIWTDGIWTFSTGLDQRIRCWKISGCGKLTEHAHLIISVPEPEALDATISDRRRYQIAVAGRGMQMVEFYASDDED